jgi:hypothetical protein
MIETIRVSAGIGGLILAGKLAQPSVIPSISKAYPLNRDTATVSNIARQLGESAVRAESRNSLLDRNELAAHARRVLDDLSGPVTQAVKEAQNTEVPDTQDAQLLKRATQATDFVVREAAGDVSAKNPFEGLTPDKLVLIAYDEKGPYTVNERRAAWAEFQNIEPYWPQPLSREADARQYTLFEILARLPRAQDTDQPAADQIDALGAGINSGLTTSS